MSEAKVDVIGLSMSMQIRPEYQGKKHPLQANQVQRTENRTGRSKAAISALANYDQENKHEQFKQTMANRNTLLGSPMGKPENEVQTLQESETRRRPQVTCEIKKAPSGASLT